MTVCFWNLFIAGLIKQSLQLQAQVTLTSWRWCHKPGECAKSYARKSVCFCSRSDGGASIRLNNLPLTDGHFLQWFRTKLCTRLFYAVTTDLRRDTTAITEISAMETPLSTTGKSAPLTTRRQHKQLDEITWHNAFRCHSSVSQPTSSITFKSSTLRTFTYDNKWT